MKIRLTILAYLLTQYALGEVPTKAEDTQPLEVGNRIPAVEVCTIDGQMVNLRTITAGRPGILIFYRGSWCPYCNRHLAALADVEADLAELGFQLLAISPDKPDNLKEAVDKHELGYTLLSDSSAEAIRAFGLAFKVDEKTLERYKGHGIDLKDASGEDHHILPVPAVYLADGDGIIRYKYANPDYKVRLSPEALLEAAKAHGLSKTK